MLGEIQNRIPVLGFLKIGVNKFFMANKNVTTKRDKWLSSILKVLVDTKDLLPTGTVEETISFNDKFSKENEDLIDIYLTKTTGSWKETFLESSVQPQLFQNVQDIVSFLRKKKEEGNKIALFYIFLQKIKDINSLSSEDMVRFATEATQNPQEFPFSPFYLNIPEKTNYLIRCSIIP